MSIEPLAEDSLNYNTCKYRSQEMQQKLIKRCSCKGGNYTIEGYFCEARQIFKVTPDICRSCPVYESR